MMLPPRETLAILGRLLDKYEASGVYGRPGPWPRAMILRWHEVMFPEAFAPSGAETRTALVNTARTLAARGALRITFGKGLHRQDEPETFRLEPEHVIAAYAAAREVGYQ